MFCQDARPLDSRRYYWLSYNGSNQKHTSMFVSTANPRRSLLTPYPYSRVCFINVLKTGTNVTNQENIIYIVLYFLV